MQRRAARLALEAGAVWASVTVDQWACRRTSRWQRWLWHGAAAVGTAAIVRHNLREASKARR